MDVLTAEDREQFRERGFVRLPRAFEPANAAAQCALIWRELERRYSLRENDPGTWQEPTKQPAKQLRKLRDHPIQEQMATPRLTGALDEILGADAWTRGTRHWGSLLLTFPNAKQWDVPTKTWHWDNPISAHMERATAVHLFFVLAPLEPGCGATLFVEGMHRVLTRYYANLDEAGRAAKQSIHRKRAIATHPWLRQLQSGEPPVDDRRHAFMEVGATIDGIPVRVHEMVGEAGDAWILNPLLLHNWAPNAGTEPRMMRAKIVTRKDFDWGYMLPPAG